MLKSLFGTTKVFIGVVHLLPLPGSPRWHRDMEEVLSRARQDALALANGGCDGIIVENFGDAPFAPGAVGPETVASMSLAVDAVQHTVGVPVGINMLRNDPASGLAVAVATGARFVRANVHYGAMVADEGLIQGMAHETLRYRHALGADEQVRIFADILVKHAAPLGSEDISHVAAETVYRGLADALIVTGSATGRSAILEEVAEVKRAVPGVPLLVGSGIDERNVERYLSLADGAIVGTSLKVDGLIHNPVDLERVKRLGALFRQAS